MTLAALLTSLAVFAAASLAGAFGELGREFQRAHPGVEVALNLAGSQQLAAQLEQGAKADVFASADDRWMAHVAGRRLLEGAPQPFAGNRLVVIVPRDGRRVARLDDLARPGLKLVIGAESVPVGRYAREMLAKLGAQPGFAAGFARRALANVVSEEESVKGVVGKVQLGEADAGVCYRTDVTLAIARFVRVIEVPASANVVASYPIAVVRDAPHPELAREFVALVRSPRGQRILRGYGFLPAGRAAR